MGRLIRAAGRARARIDAGERGAALVEAAILMPVVLLIVFGASRSTSAASRTPIPGWPSTKWRSSAWLGDNGENGSVRTIIRRSTRRRSFTTRNRPAPDATTGSEPAGDREITERRLPR